MTDFRFTYLLTSIVTKIDLMLFNTYTITCVLYNLIISDIYITYSK